MMQRCRRFLKVPSAFYFEIFFCLVRLRRRKVKNMFDLYILNCVNTSIASLATPTIELLIGNEYDFEVTEIRAKIYDATTQAGAVLASIRLSGGQYITENPIDLNMFANLSGAGVAVENYPIRV